MRHSRRFLVVLAVAALTSACSRVHATPLASLSYPPVPADSVRLFATNPPAHYVEIAMLHTQQIFGNADKAAKALRVAAGKLGANGVILLNARGIATHGGGNVGVIVGGSKDNSAIIIGDGDQGVDEFERAVAIRYETAPAVAQSAGAATPR